MTTIASHFGFKLPHLRNQHTDTHLRFSTGGIKRTRCPIISYCLINSRSLNPKCTSARLFLARVSNDSEGAADASSQQTTPSDYGSTSRDSYVALFVRMLGLDNDPLDREQAIIALWKYSLGGKKYIDDIMKFNGCTNLTVNLLKSESNCTCEAASGLLRMISSVNLYRDLVAECGAIEEITGLLSQSVLSAEVKEQSICTLWNLSADEKLRVKIANTDLLPLLIKFLDVEDLKVKEAAGGVLSNLALTHSNHSIMVEAGVIPKLAKLLNPDIEGSKVTRKEAKNALLEFAKNEYYRILIIEEGLVLVPMIGASAYKSFKPSLHSWPSLPDGTEIEQSPKYPSRFGASELLLGLNIQDKTVNIEERKMNAIVGRTQQQFLARIGAIEMEEGHGNSQDEPSSMSRFTILPWMDGVARLVLILGLEDEKAIARAADSIADSSINEHMRISFRDAGALKHLIQHLDHRNSVVRLAVARALARLSLSNDVCHVLEAEGVIYPLLNTLKHSDVPRELMEKTLDILARILDPGKELKSMFFDGPVNGLKKKLDSETNTDITKTDSTPGYRKEVLDSAVLARLVEIMKSPNPNLQRKVASILEYVTIVDPCIDSIISMDIQSGLDAVFSTKVLDEPVFDTDDQLPEFKVVELEEAGLAISAASRLLTKLLKFDQFRHSINLTHFTRLLRKTLKSDIPLHNKDWVAACLVKINSFSNPYLDFENDPIITEVVLYKTIPRLIEKLKSSFSQEEKESAVVELNRIVSEGMVDWGKVIASNDGILPLVNMIGEGSDRGVESGLAILYNLSMDNENHSAILAVGAVPILRRIVLSKGPRWMQALQLLRVLPS